MGQWKTITQEHPAIQYLMKKDKRLAKVIAMVGDIEYEEQADCFARLVRSIVGPPCFTLWRADYAPGNFKIIPGAVA